MARITKIGLQNFRVFKDLQSIELAPITILTGQNNSGKSSVIKSLLLLTENAKENNFAKLDFKLRERKHNLGNFENVLNDTKKEFYFLYEIYGEDVLTAGRPEFDEDFITQSRNIQVTLIYEKDDKSSAKLKTILLHEVLNNKPEIILAKTISDNNEKENDSINLHWFYKDTKHLRYSHFIGYGGDSKTSEQECSISNALLNLPDLIGEDVLKKKLKDFDKEGVNDFIEEFNERLFDNLPDIFFYISHEGIVIKYLKDLAIEHNFPKINKVGDLFSGDDDKYNYYLQITGDILIKDIIDISDLHIIFENTTKHAELLLSNIINIFEFDYLESQKSNSDRIYPLQSQSSAFENLLKQYRDINFSKRIEKEKERAKKNAIDYEQRREKAKAKLLKAGYEIIELSTKELQKIPYDVDANTEYFHYKIDKNKKHAYHTSAKEKSNEKTQTEKKLDFINFWMGKDGFNLGTDIKITEQDYSTEVKLTRNGRDTDMVDLGTGSIQILALLLKIILIVFKDPNYTSNPVLMLEEPEINLHPNLQSKLADMFVEAYKKFRIYFIIETHSEYLIRKLQYLTAKKDIEPEDTVIHYFNNPDEFKEGEEQVKTIIIKENGVLTQDFGSGFFDEADNLSLDLFFISKVQKN